MIFLFFSPVVSILLNYPFSPLSAALLQIIAAFLAGFGLALALASRNLDQHLLIPFANIPARLIAFVVITYYVLLGLPPALLVLGIIDGAIGFILVAFIIVIPDYRLRSVFKQASTEPY